MPRSSPTAVKPPPRKKFEKEEADMVSEGTSGEGEIFFEGSVEGAKKRVSSQAMRGGAECSSKS